MNIDTLRQISEQSKSDIELSDGPKFDNMADLIRSFKLDQRLTKHNAISYFEHGRKCQELSYIELYNAISSLQFQLNKQLEGNTSNFVGKRIAIITGNSPEFIVSAMAIMGIGAIAVPINPLDNIENIKYILAHAQVTCVICGTNCISTFSKIIEYPIVNLNLTESIDDAQHRVQLMNDRELPAVLLYTSGTTGKPKGVLLSQFSLLVNATALIKNFNIDHTTRHLCILPLYHANAWGFSMISTLLAGGHLVLCDTFPLLSFWKIIREEQINITSLVPSIYKVLAQMSPPTELSDRLHNIVFVSAAAPLPKELALKVYETLGIMITQGYGLSECTNFATLMPTHLVNNEYLDRMFAHNRTCIGAPVFGCDVQVVDHSHKPLEELQEGQLVVKSLSNMIGYWRDPDSTRQAFEGNLLNTGDIGFYKIFNNRKYFYITGRQKEIIIRNGENISPLFVESQLNELDNSMDYAVVGFANEHTGEEVGLYLDRQKLETLFDSKSSDQIVNNTQALVTPHLLQIPYYYRPKVVLVGKLSNHKTGVGKIMRKALSKQYEAFGDKLFRESDSPKIYCALE